MQTAEALLEIIEVDGTGERRAVKIACVVRWGVAGKGSAPAETSPAAYPAGTGDER